MKLSEYIKSRLWQYLLKFSVSLLCLALLWVFKMPSTLLVMIVIMMGTTFFVVELVEFHQKKSYYQELFQQLNQLEEQALLVHSISAGILSITIILASFSAFQLRASYSIGS